MTPERYKRLTDWLEGHPALREGIILLNRWLPLVPFLLSGASGAAQSPVVQDAHHRTGRRRS